MSTLDRSMQVVLSPEVLIRPYILQLVFRDDHYASYYFLLVGDEKRCLSCLSVSIILELYVRCESDWSVMGGDFEVFNAIFDREGNVLGYLMSCIHVV